MKFMQILDARPSLQKLAAQDLTIKTLYKVSKLLGRLDEELAFYDKQREKILAKYCDIVGNQYVPREEDMAKLNAEMGELLDTDIESEVQEVAININEDVKLSCNDLMSLQGFVSIEE